jgi:hypothetical protein
MLAFQMMELPLLLFLIAFLVAMVIPVIAALRDLIFRGGTWTQFFGETWGIIAIFGVFFLWIVGSITGMVITERKKEAERLERVRLRDEKKKEEDKK